MNRAHVQAIGSGLMKHMLEALRGAKDLQQLIRNEPDVDRFSIAATNARDLLRQIRKTKTAVKVAVESVMVEIPRGRP
jgi:hypothetical protein